MHASWGFAYAAIDAYSMCHLLHKLAENMAMDLEIKDPEWFPAPAQQKGRLRVKWLTHEVQTPSSCNATERNESLFQDTLPGLALDTHPCGKYSGDTHDM